MAAIELYTPQGAEMVSGMMYEPYEQGVIMRLEHHLVGGYVRYISPHIIIIIITYIHKHSAGEEVSQVWNEHKRRTDLILPYTDMCV